MRNEEQPNYPEPTRPADHCPQEVVEILSKAIAVALGDQSNVAYYRSCLRRTPLRLVELSFTEAVALPERQVRKSRGAYFAYMVKLLLTRN